MLDYTEKGLEWTKNCSASLKIAQYHSLIIFSIEFEGRSPYSTLIEVEPGLRYESSSYMGRFYTENPILISKLLQKVQFSHISIDSGLSLVISGINFYNQIQNCKPCWQ